MTPLDYYFFFIDTLANFPWGALVFIMKALALIISLTMLAWYISTLSKMKALSPPEPLVKEEEAKFLPKEVVAQPWIEIQQKMASMNPADWGLAVIQADAVLDKILKASGYLGDTMADRLRQINQAELGAIEDIWRSHKIRNRLAHGIEGSLTREEAELAIRGYEKAFRELNYIA